MSAFARSLWVGAVGCSVSWAGCSSSSSDPCSFDALGCKAAGELEVDEGCTLDDELLVQVGSGRQAFEALDHGQPPEVHYGSQGGMHVFVAVRVDNPDPAHASFLFEISADHVVGSSHDVYSREVLVENAKVTEGEAFEQAGLVLVIDYFDAGELMLEVTDSCGRTGTARHSYTSVEP